MNLREPLTFYVSCSHLIHTAHAQRKEDVVQWADSDPECGLFARRVGVTF